MLKKILLSSLMGASAYASSTDNQFVVGSSANGAVQLLRMPTEAITDANNIDARVKAVKDLHPDGFTFDEDAVNDSKNHHSGQNIRTLVFEDIFSGNLEEFRDIYSISCLKGIYEAMLRIGYDIETSTFSISDMNAGHALNNARFLVGLFKD